ncbi:hypothetical protein BGZ46_002738 [Entomortierella lignicola]|nr:hypothetical protein BGZ46_002738 [Entomortierella lignicola]
MLMSASGQSPLQVCPYCDDALPEQMSAKLESELSKINREKVVELRRARVEREYNFCRLHIAESKAIPDGLKRDYPSVIDFSLLEHRTQKFRDQMMDIITRKKSSTYLKAAIERYESSPFRSRGAHVGVAIIDKTMEVLVPESGLLLIAEDLRLKAGYKNESLLLEEALKVMMASVEYGMAKFDSEDAEDP